VQMLNLGFPFSKGDLFTLNSIAGLDRGHAAYSIILFYPDCWRAQHALLYHGPFDRPAIGTGFALQDVNTPLWVFQLLALLCGFGGGNFASSMSISASFFQKKFKDYPSGSMPVWVILVLRQRRFLFRFVMTFGLFGGDPMILTSDSGTLIGKIPAGLKHGFSIPAISGRPF
jgi:NNP family nitrate/nitrite transporter-like MFS transporter